MAMSATLAINELTAAELGEGRALVPLGFGEAGLPVHPDLVAALAAGASTGSYGPVAGIPALRAAAAGWWTRRGLPTDAAQVVAGPGTKPLLYTLLHACEGAVAVPRPSWVSYAAQALLLRREVHHVPTLPGQGGVPDPERLETAAAAARRAGRPLAVVVVTLPDNPTGTLAGADTVRALCAVARRHGITVVSDEIYRDLVHDPALPFLSPAEVAPERTVVTTGLSKSLAVGGWRIGVARLPEGPLGAELHTRVVTLASEIWSSPGNPVQQAAAWAFTEPPVLRERIRDSRRLHASVAAAVAGRFAAAGADVARPTAAFYVYPDLSRHRAALEERWAIRTSADLARVLLAQLDVATLPGSAFGELPGRLTVRAATSLLYGDDPQRLAALASPDPPALPRIATHLTRLSSALHRLLEGAGAGPAAGGPRPAGAAAPPAPAGSGGRRG